MANIGCFKRRIGNTLSPATAKEANDERETNFIFRAYGQGYFGREETDGDDLCPVCQYEKMREQRLS